MNHQKINPEDLKFKGKYNPRSKRLKDYDYTSSGAYFITICTKDKENFFGKIIHKKIILNNLGSIIQEYLLKIEEKHNFILLDEFIIMPNHLHFILFITSDKFSKKNNLKTEKINKISKFKSLAKKSISSVLNQFKGATTKYIRNNTDLFSLWQPNFYDRIIRNEDELNRIRQYIFENPEKWDELEDDSENIFM